MTAEQIVDHPLHAARPAGFADWRGRLDREQTAPVIAIAGSRGKTSVLRAVESILRAGGRRFASWTDGGVEIEGERQRGELGPWSRALTRLSAGGIDLALQEMDWVTAQTIGATASYPIVAITNLCANNEACLVTPEMFQARKALSRVRESVAAAGRLILNADDFIVSEPDPVGAADRYLIGISVDTPVLRRHLQRGGDACWIDGSSITIQEARRITPIVDVRRLAWTRGGAIPFAVQNALLATAVARSCGLPPRLIASGLCAYDARAASMPGSFNLFDIGGSTIVVDQPTPPWFLRSTLRAASNLGSGHQLRVVGPMLNVAADDLLEVGRLLGRAGGVLVTHGTWTDERLDQFRQGVASNDVPPLFVQAADERSATHQALGMLRPDDVMLVLAENPSAVVRQLSRRARRRLVAARE